MPRKQHTYHYIYKTTCKITGKYYVGMHSTSNLEDEYIGSGKRLWNSIRKHGRENHEIEILEWFPDRSSLKDREKQLVNESLLQDPMCMNLALGGEGGYRGEDAHRKWSSAGGKGTKSKLDNDIEFRVWFSSLQSERIMSLRRSGKIKAPDWSGRSHSQETRSKISNSMTIAQKGEKNSQFGTVWIKHEDLGTKKIKKADLESFLAKGWVRGR